MNTPLISTYELNDMLSDPELIILDTSFKNNPSGKSSEFEGKRIKHSRYFDLKGQFSDPKGEFPNTMPDPEQFELACQALGINQRSKIVVYDNIGIYVSPRVWWMFKIMGHHQIAVLDGGLPEWVRNGYELENEINHLFTTGGFQANPSTEPVKDYDFMKENVVKEEFKVIDARSKARFDGTVEEARAGLKSGHIPKSINLPYTELLENGKFKSKEEIVPIFQKIVSPNEKLVFTCGSGVTACILLLASEMVQENETAVYDGSWTEWGTLDK